jgi:energy-coupling factor transporter ATP-binding protein EcfA2
MGPKALEISKLKFSYRGSERFVIDGLDYEQEAGKLVMLAGRSGAGKSTLCKIIAGAIPTSQMGEISGEVKVFGKSVLDSKPFEMIGSIGIVFQDFESQLFSTSVELEVAFGLENLAIPREEMRRIVYESLEQVGLREEMGREPWKLSGGEKQRLAIASAIAMRPKILLLDEPMTDIDPIGREEISRILEDLKEKGMTMLLVDHDVEGVPECDILAIMENGSITRSGKFSEISSDPLALPKYGIRPHSLRPFLSSIGISGFRGPEDASEKFLEMIGEERLERIRKAWEKLHGKRMEGSGYNIMELRDIRYSYLKGKEVIKGISLNIRDGEFVAIIGPNGSGKTTLAKIMGGILKPDSGDVLFRGKAGFRKGKDVGYVFQNPDQQIFATSVFDEVAFGPRNLGKNREEVKEAVEKALDAVGLIGREKEDPFQMTRGDRQKVAVASVLACDPQLIILDEPTTGLDYEEQLRMMEFLKMLNDSGKTVAIITHSMWVVAQYAERCVVVKDGQVALDGPTREVFSKEEELKSLHIRVPEITSFGNKLGITFLSASEAIELISSSIDVNPSPPFLPPQSTNAP